MVKVARSFQAPLRIQRCHAGASLPPATNTVRRVRVEVGDLLFSQTLQLGADVVWCG
jgi:hypothetical protein